MTTSFNLKSIRTIVAMLCLFAVNTGAQAQSEKYIKSMEGLVSKLDTTWSVTGLTALGNSFQRIADAEKTQWLPFYYAAYCQVASGYAMMGGQTSAAALDPVADKATAALNSAEALTKDNSEIYVIRKMIASLRMMVDPMNRFMTEGPAAQSALDNARKLNPNNPRVYLLEAQDKFYTPEQYGGDKKKAKELLEKAMEMFNTLKPASAIEPAWGIRQAQHLQGEMNK